MIGPHGDGDLIGNRYEVLGFLGEGGMQYVYKANDLVLQRQVALKTPKNKSAEKRFKRSAVVAARVNHPNIAKTLDYIEENEQSYLVEELIEGRDLDAALLKRVPCLDPYLAARVAHHLAKGLAAAHHAGVVHRDLKPTNVMVMGEFQLDQIKITDFGIAKLADEELTSAAEGGQATLSLSATAVGALPYMSPEAIDSPKKVTYCTDVWSIGAMLYQLMTGQLPFGNGLRAVAKILEANPPEFPSFLFANAQFAPLAEELKSVVLNCLQKEPLARPTADDLVSNISEFCYPISERYTGTVREIKHRSWGFIESQGRDVFFHLSSVYGKPPVVGSHVVFSKFIGGGAQRAHPVIVSQNG